MGMVSTTFWNALNSEEMAHIYLQVLDRATFTAEFIAVTHFYWETDKCVKVYFSVTCPKRAITGEVCGILESCKEDRSNLNDFSD